MFSDCSNLKEIPNFNTNNVISMSSMFSYCNHLIEIPNFNTSNVTEMSYMFTNCSNLINIPVLNMKNVINIREMFNNCINLSNQTLENIAISLPNYWQLSDISTDNLTEIGLSASQINYLSTTKYAIQLQTKG